MTPLIRPLIPANDYMHLYDTTPYMIKTAHHIAEKHAVQLILTSIYEEAHEKKKMVIEV
jgi:hypothetical protein